jgi:hypothetical protein
VNSGQFEDGGADRSRRRDEVREEGVNNLAIKRIHVSNTKKLLFVNLFKSVRMMVALLIHEEIAPSSDRIYLGGP